MLKMLIAIVAASSISVFAEDMRQEITTNNASIKRLATFLNGKSIKCAINKHLLVRINADLNKSGSVGFVITHLNASDYFGDGPVLLEATADWLIVSDAPADMEQYLMFRVPNGDVNDQADIAAVYTLIDSSVDDGAPSTKGLMCSIEYPLFSIMLFRADSALPLQSL